MKTGKTAIPMLAVSAFLACINLQASTYELDQGAHRHWTGSVGIVAGGRHRSDLLEVDSV